MTDGALGVAEAERSISPRGRPATARRHAIGEGARYLGALAVLAVGIDHFVQFSSDDYSVIPTIGTLFALNFASSLVLALLAPVRRFGGRFGGLTSPRWRWAGSPWRPGRWPACWSARASGCSASWARLPSSVVLSIALDVVALVLLGVFLAASPIQLPRHRG